MNDLQTQIYLVRHGQSVGNLNRAILGHTDLDLTELGVEQAQKCARFLKETHVDAIFSSDLKRAYSTAREHAELRKMSIIRSFELRELYFGDWEGVRVADVEHTDLYSVSWKENFGTFTAPNGESVQALAQRVYSFIEKKAIENPSKSLIFVFHAAAIRSFWGKISEIPFENLARVLPFPDNASVSHAIYSHGKFTPLHYSINTFL